MSEDGFSDPYDEPSMDLIIETLTGTSFEMKVYPTDIVLDIKNKIHRVEGIPVYHQNLLFQMKELPDYVRLCDAGLVNGSVLKLVLSMRGGPISTRRLSTCDHHIIWKDLKDLIEHSRDDTDKSGSKVSVLVFKEGEVINVIRVIENEDGSYSPYTDKAISPPYSRNKEKDDLQQTFFKKISEDMEMATKMHMLKSRMRKLRQQRHSKGGNVAGGGDASSCRAGPSYDSASGKHDLNFIELELPTAGYRLHHRSRIQRPSDDVKIIRGGNIGLDDSIVGQPENGEIALKEKHRTRTGKGKLTKTAEAESKPYFSKNLHIFGPDPKKEPTDEDKILNNSILSPLYSRYPESGRSHRRSTLFDGGKNDTLATDPITILEDTKQDGIDLPCTETLSLSARNRVHLTRLVLQDTERGKSSPDSIELEENSQEMWEIQPDSIKSSGAYQVGLLKRRTSVDHNYDTDFSLESSTNNLEREDFNQNSEYEVFGRNFYHVPQFVSAPSAIPPQYAPKDDRICDLYLGSPVSDTKIRRSPLYGRRSKNSTNVFEESTRSLDETKLHQNANSAQLFSKLKSDSSFGELASNIERLQNDYNDLDYEDFDVNYADDMFGYYNATCTSELDKILNCNHPRYKETSWNKSTDDAQLANQIKRLSFDMKLDEEKPGKVQIETTKLEDLPAVVSKKRMRCGQCNKRLNITNIYNCRCGRIFCSQHRYSESHECKYDYKSEGRKLLEQQNPLVTATKLTKF